MAVAIRSVGYDEQLSVVDHLAELRTRLIVSLAALAVAFGLCMWQNRELLHVINAPLAHQTKQQVGAGKGPLGATYKVQRSALDLAGQLSAVVSALQRPGSGTSPATRAALHSVTPHLRADIAQLAMGSSSRCRSASSRQPTGSLLLARFAAHRARGVA